MKKSIIGAALAAAACAGTAGAETIAYQGGGAFGSPNYSRSVTWSDANQGIGGTNPGGLFRLTGDTLGDFVAFCVDVAQNIASPQSATINPGLFGADVVTNLARMFDAAMGGQSLDDVIDSDDKAAGMQMAVWEVAFETSDDLSLTTGTFLGDSTAGANAWAATYLGGVFTGDENGVSLTFLDSADNQDLVTVTNVAAVPVPAAGLLLLSGLGGIAALRRRKRA